MKILLKVSPALSPTPVQKMNKQAKANYNIYCTVLFCLAQIQVKRSLCIEFHCLNHQSSLVYLISKLIDCLQIYYHIAGWSAKKTEIVKTLEYNSLEGKELENAVVNIKK